MEPMKLYFDFRDIFRSPRLALSVKKIWLFLKANLFGFAFYWILSYLAILLSGIGFSEAINKFGLYPCLYCTENISIISQILYWVGIAIWIISIFYACTAVSRITFRQLKGDDFYSVADARKFVKNHRYPIILSWISILLIAAFFSLGAVIFALIGKIPYVGELLFALLYIVYFFGSVFTVYTLIVFIKSFIYSPAIVSTMEEDKIGTLFLIYSISWSQPWRLVLYNLLLLPIVAIGIMIFKWFWFTGYKLINIIFGADWLMGTKLHNVVGWATNLVNPKINFCNFLRCTDSVGDAVKHQSLLSVPDSLVLSSTEYVAGTIVAIILFILLMSIVSYGLSILSVGETIMFTIFKKKSNDENLLLIDDEDGEFEDANVDNILEESSD
jgi:hypothetical protein